MSAIQGSSRPLIFVDTSALYALADHRDAHHDAAMAITENISRTGVRLYTTNLVVAETHALVLARRGRLGAWRVLERIDRSTTTVIHPTEDDELRTRLILVTYDDKSFTLTDAISFAVIERLGLSAAFTFDRHFAQYGLAILTPSH
jgi:predicted nucleic acid-binding protein